jgi:hypothetical protein
MREDTVQGRFAMNRRRKILTVVLPVAILAGAPGAGLAAAEPARTASIQTPQTLPQGAMPQAAPPQAPAAAAQTPYAAPYEGHITVRADRTATDVFTKRFKILAPSAIALVSQQQETYVEGMESLDTVEAFTQKADGAQVPVDPANIITRDAVTGLASTFTRDLKQRTVIFQDVQVGDTVVLTQRRQTRRGLFPGQFFYADVFPRNLPVAAAQIIIKAPAGVELQVKAIGAALSARVEDTGDIRRQHRHVGTKALYAPGCQGGGVGRCRSSAPDLDLQVVRGNGARLWRRGPAQGQSDAGDHRACRGDHERHRGPQAAGDGDRRLDEKEHPLCCGLSLARARRAQ